MRSMLQAAKFLYSSESSARPDEGEKACESFTQLLRLGALCSASSFWCSYDMRVCIACILMQFPEKPHRPPNNTPHAR